MDSLEPSDMDSQYSLITQIVCYIKFTNARGYSFYATFVYAKNTMNERFLLWNAIQNIAISIIDKDWLILGDFNEVTNPTNS